MSMKNNFFHPLMHNNFLKEDFLKIKSFLDKGSILTQATKVLEFEDTWSKWLGVRYSVFVNSGSSANFLTIAALKYLYLSKTKKREIIVPTLTWVSDIVSVIQNGFKPVFVDIDITNLAMSEKEILKKISKKTFAVFITHAQGFNGLSNNIIEVLKEKKIILIEDVCESHGATFENKKLGTYGLASNFSFYYAHHMSTIEGGMICTNNRNIYEITRMLRGHGMLRECNNKILEETYQKKYKDLSPKFIFLYPGFNMRNNEISAVLGLNQIKRLDTNNIKRTKNLILFLENLNSNFFLVNFDLKGSSNYAFPVILRQKSFQLRNKLEKLMKINNIEFRRGNAGGGNQLRQPYLKKYIKNIKLKNFPNVEHVHFFGYYIGNFPDLKKSKILKICSILNTLSNNR
jgi:CDP-6-deoxy-D-xylo-4-hexulose-3-dehydrase